MTTARKWARSRSPKEKSSATAATERPHVDDLAKLGWLFEPDALASAQYFDNLQRNTLMEPEKRLMMAILDDAIHCFQDNVLAKTGKAMKLFQEAEEWVSKERADWIFSFRNVCELLELDPEYLRAGLALWKQKRLAHETF